MTPSREITNYVTERILGKPFIIKGSPENTDSFSCWSLVWHYEKLSGLVLPYDVYSAAEQFKKVDDKPQWRDILSHKNWRSVIPHLGVVESHQYVLHCNNQEYGVVRDEYRFPPWDESSVWRHVSLCS